MFHQTIYGTPRCCPNRLCRHEFYRESHLGWMPKSEVEAYAIMRCPKCKYTFAVVQLLSMVHSYMERLPPDPKKSHKRHISKPITTKEINRVRKKMDSENVFTSLNDGMKPGASPPPEVSDQ